MHSEDELRGVLSGVLGGLSARPGDANRWGRSAPDECARAGRAWLRGARLGGQGQMGLVVRPQHATSGLAMGANKPQDAHITAVVIRESGAAAVGPAWVRFARCLASVRLCLD